MSATKIIAPIFRVITFYFSINHKIKNHPPTKPNFYMKPHADGTCEKRKSIVLKVIYLQYKSLV